MSEHQCRVLFEEKRESRIGEEKLETVGNESMDLMDCRSFSLPTYMYDPTLLRVISVRGYLYVCSRV